MCCPYSVLCGHHLCVETVVGGTVVVLCGGDGVMEVCCVQQGLAATLARLCCVCCLHSVLCGHRFCAVAVVGAVSCGGDGVMKVGVLRAGPVTGLAGTLSGCRAAPHTFAFC